MFLSRVRLNYASLEQVANVVKLKLASSPAVRDVQLIDVRSTAEVATTGMIPSAINIPLSILTDVLDDAETVSEEDFMETFMHTPMEKERTQLIFYCAHGVRSAVAADIAEGMGYRNPLNFSGSWAQWFHAFGDASESPRGDTVSSPRTGP